jgi:hypothetical protein
MHDQILENVDQKPYLGIQFTNTLKWDTHINNILTKANTSLGFLRRNISKFPEEITKRASQAKVRPNVEYASSAWDPYQENHIKKIGMVQRRSARVIKHQYSREPGSATNILTDLKLPIKQQNRTTRQYYPRKFRNVQTSSNTYTDSQFSS